MTGARRGAGRRLLDALTAPHPDLDDVADRRRARLLASLLFVLVLLGTASGFIQLALVPGFATTFAAMSGALALLAAAYLAARSRHYRVGGWIAALAPLAGCIWVAVDNPDDRVWYAFMLLGVLLASIFLSTRAAALVAALALASIAVLVAAVPELQTPDYFVPPLMLHAVMSPLLLIAAHHRNRLEEERMAARLAMEQQVRESRRLETIGRLAGGVAHDFNNLLTVVFANLSLMRRDPQGRMASGLGEIEAVASRAAELTRQLLAFARRQVLESRVIDLNDVLDGVEKILARLLGEDIDLEIERAPGRGRVKADPAQIEQVILNLALNGRDAMPNGGTLSIALSETDRDGVSHAVVAVTDTGEGMDGETLERVFEPFFTTKRGSRGTGLGLAMVHGIVTQSGGCIEATSEPGAGSRFEVYLPRVDEPVRVEEETTPGPQRAPGELTVLLVEDEGALRRVTEKILADAGYRVLTASDGERALEIGARHGIAIDLLVTDVVMPGLNGPDVARALLAERAGLPVLFISGYAEQSSLRADELAGSAFLAKPFTPGQLTRKIARLFGERGMAVSGSARSRGSARP